MHVYVHLFYYDEMGIFSFSLFWVEVSSLQCKYKENQKQIAPHDPVFLFVWTRFDDPTSQKLKLKTECNTECSCKIFNDPFGWL